MRVFGKTIGGSIAVSCRLGAKLCALLLVGVFGTARAHADATLLLQEPYSLDGALAGTGHAAVYLDHVCAATPVQLRPCEPGETGVVLSRYHEIAGYDWIAIPLVPYLYAVERQEDVPLFADAKMVAFLRDQYRRKYLEELAPDRPDGGAPPGEWYELVGASYLRTIYGFAIETSPEQDAQLIARFNSRPNHKHFSLVTNNCADFARELINFYYPHVLHRNVILDLGVTTPKQLAKLLAKYIRRHPELQSSNFVIPQVPGTLRRSTPVHGVLESALSAKKYMLPLMVVHPYIFGGVLAAYFGRPRFDPSRHAPVLDSRWQLDAPLTGTERQTYQSQLDELQINSMLDSAMDGKDWQHLQAGAEPDLDSSGQPVMQVRVGGEVERVGIARGNVLNAPESSELAAKLVEARIRQELRAGSARKAAHSDLASDVRLLRQLLSVQPQTASAQTSPSTIENNNQATDAPQP